MRRNTVQRALVLEAVEHRLDHPAAQDVYLDVRKQAPHISRATVYRNLHVLVEEGKIASVKTPTGEHFDCRLDVHAHIACICCGAIADAPAAPNPELSAGIAAATGYRVSGCEYIFKGVCPTCQAHEQDIH